MGVSCNESHYAIIVLLSNIIFVVVFFVILAPVRDNFILVTDFTHGKLYQIPLNNSREIHGVHAMDVGKLKSILYNEITKTVVLVEDLSPQVWAISLDASWEYQVANLGKFHVNIINHNELRINHLV